SHHRRSGNPCGRAHRGAVARCRPRRAKRILAGGGVVRATERDSPQPRGWMKIHVGNARRNAATLATISRWRSAMRSRLFVGVSVLAVFFVLALVGAISPSTAFGAIGDTLRTVTLPTSLDCSPGIRTAIAVATGSKLGYPDKPVVLITSCSLNSAKANQLYIIDPGVAAPG